MLVIIIDSSTDTYTRYVQQMHMAAAMGQPPFQKNKNKCVREQIIRTKCNQYQVNKIISTQTSGTLHIYAQEGLLNTEQ